MTRTCAAFIVAIAVLSTNVAAQSQPAASSPSEAQIHNILVQRIDEFHQSVGIVVGIIDPTGRKVVGYGKLAAGDARTPDGDTVFEIGSVTKVFTSLLLSDMVQRGEVALTDPVAKYLPAGTKVPQRNGKQITLLDLATHTSGLPTLPTNMRSKDEGNPYADYTLAQLYEFLSTYELPRDIGSQYEYSNIGVGLLGTALANRAGMDYDELVHTRITGPLGMKSTGTALSPDMKARLAVGHDSALKPVANWDLPTLAGAGALRSTANDLLTFVAANMKFTHTQLDSAISAMLKVSRQTGYPGREIALGWHVDTTEDRENSIVWHNGGTGGYRAFVGYDPKARVGIVVLANAGTDAGVDDIGVHLLYSKTPMLDASAFAPPKEHKQVEVAPAVFQKYVGRYELAPTFFMTITQDGGHFYAHVTGQAKVELFAENEKDYFFKGVDAQVSFQSDASGVVTGLVVHQMGRDTPAKRLDDAGTKGSPDAATDRDGKSAAQPPAATLDKVDVVGWRDGDVDEKPYRNLFKAMAEFERDHRHAPAASLRFRLYPRSAETSFEGLEVKIVGEKTIIPITVDDDHSFSLPRNAEAAEEGAFVKTNRRVKSFAWRVDIRSPGLPSNVRRLGDLRLECSIDTVTADLEGGFKPPSLYALAAIDDPCKYRAVVDEFFAERPVFNVTMADGARSQYFPFDWLYGNIEPVFIRPFVDTEYLRDRLYYVPLWDASWSDDALVNVEYF